MKGGIAVQITVIYPRSEEAKAELARRVAQAHAEHAFRMVRQLQCTSQQKLQLMDATITAIKAQTSWQ